MTTTERMKVGYGPLILVLALVTAGFVGLLRARRAE